MCGMMKRSADQVFLSGRVHFQASRSRRSMKSFVIPAYSSTKERRSFSIAFFSLASQALNCSTPGLINNDVIQEKSLARVYVRAGAVAITQADITDERADDSVCGFVASQFKELDFSQFLSQFNAWFAEEKKAMEKASGCSPLWCW